MKKIKIDKKKIERIISDLEKASDTFAGFGDNFWDMLSENEGNLYGEAEVLLTTCIEKLKKDRLYKKNKKKKTI